MKAASVWVGRMGDVFMQKNDTRWFRMKGYSTEIENAMRLFYESLSEKERRRYAASIPRKRNGWELFIAKAGRTPRNRSS